MVATALIETLFFQFPGIWDFNFPGRRQLWVFYRFQDTIGAGPPIIRREQGCERVGWDTVRTHDRACDDDLL
jgi:hypothetical protein